MSYGGRGNGKRRGSNSFGRPARGGFKNQRGGYQNRDSEPNNNYDQPYDQSYDQSFQQPYDQSQDPSQQQPYDQQQQQEQPPYDQYNQSYDQQYYGPPPPQPFDQGPPPPSGGPYPPYDGPFNGQDQSSTIPPPGSAGSYNDYPYQGPPGGNLQGSPPLPGSQNGNFYPIDPQQPPSGVIGQQSPNLTEGGLDHRRVSQHQGDLSPSLTETPIGGTATSADKQAYSALVSRYRKLKDKYEAQKKELIELKKKYQVKNNSVLELKGRDADGDIKVNPEDIEQVDYVDKDKLSDDNKITAIRAERDIYMKKSTQLSSELNKLKAEKTTVHTKALGLENDLNGFKTKYLFLEKEKADLIAKIEKLEANSHNEPGSPLVDPLRSPGHDDDEEEKWVFKRKEYYKNKYLSLLEEKDKEQQAFLQLNRQLLEKYVFNQTTS